jgi:hypothetical protein
MGRKKLHQRRPPPSPVVYDPALLEAVRGAIAALSAGNKEASPHAIELWIKEHRHDVWSAITSASALKGAIEAAQQAEGNGRPPTTEGSRMGRKKKAVPHGPPPELPPARERASEPPPPAEPDKVEPAPRRARAAGQPTTRARRPRARREEGGKPPAPAAPARAARSDYDPTHSELRRVLEIAREEGGVSKLRKMAQAVKALADQVGGLDRLAGCLDALEELGVK